MESSNGEQHETSKAESPNTSKSPSSPPLNAPAQALSGDETKRRIKIKIHRIVGATDPGHAVNPAQIDRQVAGSFVYGLSALFYGECTVKDGRIEQVHLEVPRNTDCPSKLASCEPLTERRAQPITGIRQHAAKAHTSPIVFGIWPSTRWPINASRYCLSTFRHYSWVSCPRTDLVGRHNQNSAPRREAINSRSSNGDKTEDHIVWLIAVSNNFLVARAAYEAAVKYNPRERWLLRDGIRVVERYQP